MLSGSKRCLTLLEKCGNMKQLKQAHAQVITCGLESNSFTLSRLMAFCAHPVHGSLDHGYKIFEQIEEPTVVISNTMIKAYLMKKETEGALEIYRIMLRNGMYPDNYTLPYMLKACSDMKNCQLGELIHGNSIKLGLSFDDYVVNSLISMYSVLGNMEAARLVFDESPWVSAVSFTILISAYAKREDFCKARLIFDKAPVKDLRIWGAMISCYVQNNCFREGLQLFRLMQIRGIIPDEAIFVSILCACAHLVCLDIGIWIHRYVMENLKLPLTVKLGTALVNMYAKCGCLDVAEKVFYKMPHRDVISWNAMISGLAMNGDGRNALRLFEEMENAGIRPDDITFISMFTALSNSGMAREGLKLLNTMCNVYKIEPKSEHYGCIIDLLGRNGLLEEANKMIQNMPNSSNVPTEEAIAWRALLNACCGYGDVPLAETAAKRLVRLEQHSGAYVLLSNIYSAVGRQESVKRVRKEMYSKGIEKAPGCSSVDINGEVHEFIAG